MGTGGRYDHAALGGVEGGGVGDQGRKPTCISMYFEGCRIVRVADAVLVGG